MTVQKHDKRQSAKMTTGKPGDYVMVEMVSVRQPDVESQLE